VTVRNGLDRLAGDFAGKFRGFRVGLVANSASVTADGRPAWDALRDAGFQVTCIFAPEHGARLEHGPGQRFATYDDVELGLEVRSLYDERRVIDSARFADVDLVLYDLPQVGCRFYTYVNTLVELLQYAHRSGVSLMVLDRPNPIRADIVEGPLPRADFTSPFGPDRVPVRYGLTMAEFARSYTSRHRLSTRLSVMLMDGYDRSMWFDQTGLPWLPTSPNMRTLDAVTVYPGTCLFEGTNLSEGRGTEAPFEQFGAPWLDADALLDRLTAVATPGLVFDTVTFTPTESKHAGQACRGLRLRVVDRDAARPVAAVIEVIGAIRRLHPDRPLWTTDERSGRHFIDVLLCDEGPRRAVDGGGPLAPVVARYDEAAAGFARERSPFLAYRSDDEPAAPVRTLW